MQAERDGISQLLLEVSPGAPTLCEGWAALDLAAHLVARDRRVGSAPGLVVPALSGYSERVRLRVRDSHRIEELAAMVRNGPPWLTRLPVLSSAGLLDGVDAAVNTLELFTHHEDLRRGQYPAAQRELDAAFELMLWRYLRPLARVLLRRSPVRAVLIWPGAPGGTVAAGPADRPTVTATGPVGELVLFAFGRTGAAAVDLDGSPADVEALRRAKLGI